MSWNVYTRVPLNTSITVTTLNSLQYCTVQYSTVQHSTVLYSTVIRL